VTRRNMGAVAPFVNDRESGNPKRIYNFRRPG
jgi:hypothetical protein